MFREPFRGPNLICKRLRNTVVLEKGSNADSAVFCRASAPLARGSQTLKFSGFLNLLWTRRSRGGSSKTAWPPL